MFRYGSFFSQKQQLIEFRTIHWFKIYNKKSGTVSLVWSALMHIKRLRFQNNKKTFWNLAKQKRVNHYFDKLIKSDSIVHFVIIQLLIVIRANMLNFLDFFLSKNERFFFFYNFAYSLRNAFRSLEAKIKPS